MTDITIIGAGKTGRGYLARLLQEPGVGSIDFIDANTTLVNQLKEAKSFEVSYFGNVVPATKIANYHAYTWENAPKLNEIVLVSVGGRNLPAVGKELQKRIQGKTYIIVAENAADPDKELKDAIGLANVQVAKSTVFCTTVDGEGINILSENYPYLQYDVDAFDRPLTELKNFRPIKGFGNFLIRKLFTYNAASAVIAYLGALAGYTDYAKAANDPRILKLLDENYAATDQAMCDRFGYEKKDQEEFAALSKAKFTNPVIVDSIARNARDPIRKAGPKERIVGSLKMLFEGGYDASVMEKTLAALLLYRDPSETEFLEMIHTLGIAGTMQKLSSIDPESPLGKIVLDYTKDPESILR